mmetsp:Transcript_23798/g.50522  ORF Transcript_23798/g.50522 Transcript_23798/m.50522 type:complete len:209 (+) Transcript_23798:120-746(+)
MITMASRRMAIYAFFTGCDTGLRLATAFQLPTFGKAPCKSSQIGLALGGQDESGEPTISPKMSQTPAPTVFSPSDMNAQQVVTTCMDAMLRNDFPYENAGFETCFDFSSDRCRAALGGSLEEFITYAHNPTFGSMKNALEYSILNVGPIISGSNTRGAMQTVLVRVTPQKGDNRTFLWTLQQERRPPRQGLWLVLECIYVENAFELTE